MAHKAHDVNDRLQLHNASISAANAAFVSATKREDARAGVDASENASLVFAHNAPGIIDADMSGDAQSLAAALDFDSMNADIQQTLENGDYSFLDKRPNTSQPAGGFGSMLHVRAESNSGRRHSIQTLMPSSDSSSSLTGFGPMAGSVSGARSMSISVDAYGSMAYTDAANHGMDMAFNAEAHNTSGAGFLMSPPRLTVSMSNNADHASAAAAATFNEDAKRRRTSEVDATPERRVEQLANEHRFLPQQTPPNIRAPRRAACDAFRSPPWTVLPISPTLPPTLRSPSSFGGEQPPKSAPPRAASDAMQRAQSQSSLSRKATDDKAAKAGANAAGNSGSATPNGKNQDVWPDDHASSRSAVVALLDGLKLGRAWRSELPDASRRNFNLRNSRVQLATRARLGLHVLSMRGRVAFSSYAEDHHPRAVEAASFCLCCMWMQRGAASWQFGCSKSSPKWKADPFLPLPSPSCPSTTTTVSSSSPFSVFASHRILSPLPSHLVFFVALARDSTWTIRDTL
ncbi:hypothetical protein L1887_42477 [Cichorium endivia]|nr:hypothetical protein L1887_42477 [Cichorium endivia]